MVFATPLKAGPSPGGFLSQLDSQQLLTFDNLTVSGAYSDADMLEVCNSNPHNPTNAMAAAEARSQFSTFAILTSPLILGNDLRNLSTACLEIITNPELIALNQDLLVSRARLVYQFPLAKWPNAGSLPPNAQSQQATSTVIASSFTGPAMTAGLVIKWCNASDPAQSFVSPSTGTPDADVLDRVMPSTDDWVKSTRSSGGFTLRPLATPTDCVTYGGYHLQNLGVAGCERPPGHTDPCSQQWFAGANSTLRPVGSDSRCLNVGGCMVKATVAMALCPDACPPPDQQQGKCGAQCTDGSNSNDSRRFTLVPAAPSPTNPTGVVTIQGTVGNKTGCVTVVPGGGGGGGGSGGGKYPGDGPVNITVQVWTKPLADGSVGVVVFNRGSVRASVEVTWPMIGLPAVTVGAVRDLWARVDRGNHVGSYTCDAVAPHDVCALRVTQVR
jgi:hypothetical protein